MTKGIMMNTKTAYDTEKLSNKELEAIGLTPQKLERHNRVGKKQCTQCAKYVGLDAVTTFFRKNNVNIVEQGESLCPKCFQNRLGIFNSLFQLVRDGKLKLDNIRR